MPRTYLTFGDIDGKLEVLRVECTRCGRKGRYHVAKLIKRYGRRGNMTKLKPGEVFYEAPNALHAVSRNASATQPLKYLVIQVSDPTKPATVPE
jgi:hypothetical protein